MRAWRRGMAIAAALALGAAARPVVAEPVDAGAASDAATGPRTPDEARAELRRRVRAMPAERWTVPGRKPWLFWAYELRHNMHEKFWGAAAAKATIAPTDPDPLRAIVAYDRMLKSAGVTLLVLPVPGKINVYGEELEPPIESELLDEPRAAFLAALRERGVRVIDFLPELRRIKASGQLAFLPRDTHWTSVSVRRAAARLGAIIRAQSWYVARDPRPLVSIEPVTELGYFDLAARRVAENFRSGSQFSPPEPVRVHQVKLDGHFVETDPKSPVVLVGDSYTTVFHSLLGHHGGLADHLAAELGFAVDQVGLAGEGAIPSSWAALARRKDDLAGKKVVIFCFGERNLTVEAKGWPVIPLVSDADGGAP